MKKILLVLFCLFNREALAQNKAPQDMIREFVQIVGDQIIDVAKDKSLNEVQRKQKIINIIPRHTFIYKTKEFSIRTCKYIWSLSKVA